MNKGNEIEMKNFTFNYVIAACNHDSVGELVANEALNAYETLIRAAEEMYPGSENSEYCSLYDNVLDFPKKPQ